MDNDDSQQPKMIFGSEDDLDSDNPPALVLIEISRRSIETRQVAPVLSRLYSLTDTVESALAFRERMTFSISGYDDDPRELPELTAVRHYMTQLTREWPHWTWFLTRGGGSIPLLFALICDVEIVRNPAQPGEYGTDFRSPRELRSRLRDMCERSDRLLRGLKLDPEAIRESRESAERELRLR